MSNKRVLLVDDCIDILEPLTMLLESEGYVVNSACNGKEALDLLQSGKELPELILLDLMMPIMDGNTFRVEQQKDPKIKGIPVVVMSASAQVTIDKHTPGVKAYLPKPIDLQRLLDVVGEILT